MNLRPVRADSVETSREAAFNTARDPALNTALNIDLDSADQSRGRWQRANAVPAPELSWQPRPPAWRRVLTQLGVPGVVGVVAFVLALGVTGVLVLQGILAGQGDVLPENADLGAGAGARLGAVEQHPFDPAASGTPAGGDFDAPGGPKDTVPNAVLIVHVVGEVVRPGVVELAPGARVRDALAAAGGPTETAVLGAVNLAREVGDGEQVVIPDADGAALLVGGHEGGGTGGGGGAGGGGGKSANALVNINVAGEAELQQLTGIGPALAARIIEWRESNGKFQSIDDLLHVSGIGAKTLARFRDMVTV